MLLLLGLLLRYELFIKKLTVEYLRLVLLWLWLILVLDRPLEVDKVVYRLHERRHLESGIRVVVVIIIIIIIIIIHVSEHVLEPILDHLHLLVRERGSSLLPLDFPLLLQLAFAHPILNVDFIALEESENGFIIGAALFGLLCILL